MSHSTRTPEGFAIIPAAVARDGSLTAMAKVVYLVLASYANTQMECWPSIATIARAAAVSPTTARKVLGELRDRNLITWEQRKDDDGDPASNLYRLGGTPAAEVPPARAEVGVPRQLVTNKNQLEQTPPDQPEAVDLSTAPGLLCLTLVKALERNGVKPPTIGKRWYDAARLLLERDGRNPAEATQLIGWATSHDFWRANILSMPKFREKYDQLRLQAEREGALQPRRMSVEEAYQAKDDQRRAWLEARGSSLEEYERRKNETGWLESLRAMEPVNA